MTQTLSSTNLDRVTELLREVIASEVLPAFRHLLPEDVVSKPSEDDPEDVVSRVDRAAEAWLGPELTKLLPGSAVVGEEAVHAEPRLIDALDSDGSVWVIDPIDGTRNFVRGETGFGVMVALVVQRKTRAAWIALPVADELFVAEAGAGTTLNGARIRIPAPSEDARPAGTLYTRYVPEPARSALEVLTGRDYEPVLGAGSAAVEYTDVVRGRKQFVVYHRLFPWDHLPGALMVEEAGGSVRLASGATFRTSDRHGPLIAAADAALGERVRGWIVGAGAA